MKDCKPDPLGTIPQPLLTWVEGQATLPPSLMKAATFYEAAKAAVAIEWPHRLDHFAALHTWTALALIVDERTRKYMSVLIREETGVEPDCA